MAQERPTPFDNIESAYEYVDLLRQALDDAYASIQEDTDAALRTDGAERRVEALRLVDHKLNQLRVHLLSGLVLLNDLRMLRRLLLGERSSEGRSSTRD
jgi:hypothetical protein